MKNNLFKNAEEMKKALKISATALIGAFVMSAGGCSLAMMNKGVEVPEASKPAVAAPGKLCASVDTQSETAETLSQEDLDTYDGILLSMDIRQFDQDTIRNVLDNAGFKISQDQLSYLISYLSHKYATDAPSRASDVVDHETESDEDEATQAVQNTFGKKIKNGRLILSSKSLKGKNFKFLLEQLKNIPSVSKLNLSSCQLGEDDLKLLVEYLKSDSSLKELYLRNNSITNTGARALAEALQENTTLTNLFLGFNNITNTGALDLVRGLEKNTTLEVLDFENNKISAKGVEELLEFVKTRVKPLQLNLKGNSTSEYEMESYSEHGIGDLVPVLQQNTSLTSLCMEERSDSSDGIISECGPAQGKKALALALKQNTSLTTLCLSEDSAVSLDVCDDEDEKGEHMEVSQKMDASIVKVVILRRKFIENVAAKTYVSLAEKSAKDEYVSGLGIDLDVPEDMFGAIDAVSSHGNWNLNDREGFEQALREAWNYRLNNPSELERALDNHAEKASQSDFGMQFTPLYVISDAKGKMIAIKSDEVEIIKLPGVDALVLDERDEVRSGDIIQVASQSNGLESPDAAFILPVWLYKKDKTQGPRVSCISLIGAKTREAQQAVYCRSHNGQCRDVMRDLLINCELEDGTNILEKYPNLVQNGYFQPWLIDDAVDLDTLSDYIETNSGDFQLITQLVNCERTNKNVLQVFNFAPSFQGRAYDKKYDRICTSVVVAQYRAIAQLAAIRAQQLRRNIGLHLTLVGQGVFSNPEIIIQKALRAVLDEVKGYDVTVYLHGFNDIAMEKWDKALSARAEYKLQREMVRDFMECVAAKTDVSEFEKSLKEDFEVARLSDSWDDRINRPKFLEKIIDGVVRDLPRGFGMQFTPLSVIRDARDMLRAPFFCDATAMIMIGVDALYLDKQAEVKSGDIVQVASQSNGLEFPSPDKIATVSRYGNIYSQGPRVSCASMIGAEVREAQQAIYYRANQQFKDVMIDLLDGCVLADGKKILEKYPSLVQIGYFQPWVIDDADLKTISDYIEKHAGDLQLMTQLVNCEGTDKNILQVFNFAPSFQGKIYDKKYDRICIALLKAQYKALAQLAAIRSSILGQNVGLHLTLVGQGTFRNPLVVIKNALSEVLEEVKNFDVTVYLHGFDMDDANLWRDSLFDKRILVGSFLRINRHMDTNKMQNMEAWIRSVPYITEVCLQNLALTNSQDLVPVLESLLDKSTLLALDLSDTEVCVEAAKRISALLSNNLIIKLILKGSQLGDAGVSELANGIGLTSSLEELCLAHNRIGDTGMSALSNAFQANSSVIELDLDSNRVGPQGVQAFSDALSRNSSLTKLSLSGNSNGLRGIETLSEGLKKNSSLTCVDLRSNGLSLGDKRVLADAMESNITITEVKV